MKRTICGGHSLSHTYIVLYSQKYIICNTKMSVRLYEALDLANRCTDMELLYSDTLQVQETFISNRGWYIHPQKRNQVNHPRPQPKKVSRGH